MKRTLDTIAARARDHLRREKLGEAFSYALQEAMPLLPAGAFIALLLRVFGAPVDALATLGIAAAPFALWVAWRSLGALRIPVTRGAALGRVDGELNLHDRLRTADAFLAVAEPSGFMQAAIADAAPHLSSARTTELPDRGARPERRGPVAATSAFLILLVALLMGHTAEPTPTGSLVAHGGRNDGDADRTASGPLTQRRLPARSDTPQQGEPRGDPAQQKASFEQAGTRDKTRRGSAATGRTARTGGSGAQARSADATGAPSAAGRASAQKLKQKPKESKPQRKKRRKTAAPSARTPPRRDSGATSGSARSSGSSKNPTASDWKTRDTPPDQMEEPEADDEEVEDESEDSEARGGVQPNLRSRKPPVNRDLGIGFGNRSNRRSNGRGGASPRKKSRGTASLVLGVPVPDHIKGQPSPGMTKVTRERGEPEREKADALKAQERKQRPASAGTVPRASMPPWLKELVRRYFAEDQEQDS